MFRLLMAGGGTGGHLFPAVAVAEEFMRRAAETQVLFVGTGRPVEREIFEPRGLTTRKITASGFMGKTLPARALSLAKLPVGMIQSAALLLGFRPHLLFCVGGYAAGPVGLTARGLGFPTAVHEQNSIPGMTTRLLGRIANLIFISFESSREFFPSAKTYLTGNPVRQEIMQSNNIEEKNRTDGFSLLVVGGSQGAHAINMAVVESMRMLSQKRATLSIVHQTGTADCETISRAYRDMSIKAEVFPFIQDMGKAYQKADLVICRAGALTVAELAALGRPAIFIPLPTAAKNHQEINVLSLVESGGAEMIRQKNLTPSVLTERLTRYMSDPEKLRAMGRLAKEAAKPFAAREICDICLDYLETRKKGRKAA
ncbi:MAG: undecaprenyldiphospho-muramoylpentapeptide beta-N-acetylglucosaminyltransferase [Deltaproteobacteria bacterium]|nr:undecaprenyldiphospho-muramoylpentapeptide beta-N-acetylglucosaminyltransferase [Deltaproteobacteria bacterium]